jgi:hypothetical protein
VLRPVRVDPSGVEGPSPGEARGPGWQRTSRGWYLPSQADLGDVEQRIACALPLLRRHEAVIGWAALRWRGGTWFSGGAADGSLLPVTLATTRRAMPQPGFAISQEFVRPAHRSLVASLPVTSAVWAAAFEARYAGSWWRALETLEMAAYSDLVSRAECAALSARLSAWTGVGQLRRAVEHMDENSWSPRETRMRLVWTEAAGPARPLCNRPVFDLAGRHLGTPDLIDPVTGVVGEYDGELHLQGRQRTRDLDRESVFRDAGLEVVTMVAADYADTSAFVARLWSAYRRAGRGERPRQWTLTMPRGWVDTSTVEVRRALDGWQRRRLLGYRRAS